MFLFILYTILFFYYILVLLPRYQKKHKKNLTNFLRSREIILVYKQSLYQIQNYPVLLLFKVMIL